MRREDRFIGHGNFVCGEGHNRIKAWKINCASCSATKMLTMPTGALPPDAVVKRIVQSGWELGKKPDQDHCPSCVNGRRNQQEKQERDKINGPAQSLERSTTFDQMSAVNKRERQFIAGLFSLLVDGKVEEAIKRIENHLPYGELPKRPPPPRQSQSPPKPTADDDFEKWLTQQEAQHKLKGESR